MAICVSCRKPICQSCSTLWEGIHCCVDCLAQRRAAIGEKSGTLKTAGLVLASLALIFALTVLRAWIGAALAGLQ